MPPVKSRTAPEVPVDQTARLRQLLALLSEFQGIPWGPKHLAAWLRGEGHELADSTPKKWPGRGVPEPWARRIADAALKRGVVVSASWIRDGKGASPRKGGALPPDGSHVDRSASDRPLVRVSNMKAAARRIAEALEGDLRRSETLIDLNRRDVERQRALIWGLKDLARQLHRTGYDMQELFALTDELAAEIGLPPHPPHLEGKP